jgi:2'-hydroxyisoflavone reductase
MRILIVGGTRFVGRHITAAALAAGHEVALLHRGRSGAELFPEATHLLADRNGDLGVLSGTRWDATIDVSAYLPRQVSALASALAGNGGHYVYISSVSVYETPAAPGYAEDSPVRTLPPGQPVPDTVTDETYGALKVLCERAATEHFGADSLLVRPTYVIGPWDHSGRFTYWVHRLARGGVVLAPGHADRPVQVIDARDLAAFVVHGAATRLGGTFHTVTPSMSFGSLLTQVAAEVAPPGTRLVWVEPRFLLDRGQTGETLPLWYAGDDEDVTLNTADPAAATKAGLTERPLSESIRDARPDEPVPGFLSPEREADLLAEWSVAQPGTT